MTCAALREPDEEQIRQIIALYRAQGWWDAGDACQKQLAARLISGSHCFVAAVEDQDLVGMGRAISDGISDAYIQDLAVRSDHRRRGIGTLIIRKLIEILHNDGIFWIGLIAEPGSEILYRHAGFKEMVSATPMLMASKNGLHTS